MQCASSMDEVEADQTREGPDEVMDINHDSKSKFEKSDEHETLNVPNVTYISVHWVFIVTNLWPPLYFSVSCGSPVVKVSDHGKYVMSLNPVPLKSRRVGTQCALNQSRAQKSSRWWGVLIRRGGASSGVIRVTSPWLKMTRSVTKSPRIPEQRNVNILSLTCIFRSVY
ncbi:uncharacterized protein TNCV_2486911 [Trichonephila clavipes]|uniref:Uncharacterized protein n=1 Tax=Trichonephila clavipes TaxID=2585209 RepID=A0A8X6W0F6_TRICX|nr:uncharacterized protein TNCV_2486911 [Trichonephila clavipes]